MEAAVSQAVSTLKGMWQKRWVGVVVAWIAGIIGGGVIFLMPDKYEASARIYVDTQTMLRPLLSGLAIQPDINEQVVMLSRTLISRPNVERLLRMTDLDLRLKSQADREDMIDQIMKTLTIKMAGGDNLYTVAYRDKYPQEAQKIVQSLVSIFVESSLGAKRKDSDQARRFIEEQISGYEQKLAEAENRLKEFRLKNMGVNSSDGKDYFGQMAALLQQLEQARMDFKSAEQSRDALKRELSGEDPVFLAEESNMEDDPLASLPELDSRIAAQKSKLDELLRVYTDAHPDVVGTRRVLDQLEAQRKEELAARKKPGPRHSGMAAKERNPVYQQLRVAIVEAEAQVASLRTKVSEYERRYQALGSSARMVPEVEAEFAQLNRDYEVQKRNYETLVQRRESASMSEKMDESAGSVDFRVVDPPRVSPKPVAPNRLMLLPLVLLAAIGTGLAASLAASQLLPVFFDTRVLHTEAGRPVLGVVSLQESPATVKRKRRGAMAFAGSVGALLAAYGGVIGLLLVMGNKG